MPTTLDPTSCRPTISLRRHGHTLFITPAVDELSATFCMWRHEPCVNNGVVQMRRSLTPLLRRRREGLCCPAGLDDLVVEMLHRLRYDVEDQGRASDSELKELGHPQSLSGRLPRPIDARFLEVVRTAERGLVGYNPSQVVPAWLVAQVALAWPQSRIACATTHVQSAFDLRASIERMICEPVAEVNHRHHSSTNARIVVGTYQYLGGAEGDLHNRDILFSLSPAEMIANEYGKLTIRNANQSRLFGFLPTGIRWTPHDRDWCRAVFGRRELAIPRHGQSERPVCAIFLPIRGGPSLSDTGSMTDLLRRGIWNHPIRNRRIARIGRILAGGGDRTLKAVVGDDPSHELLSSYHPGAKVGVLVANIEQALELCRALPDWRLISDTTVLVWNMSYQDVEFLKAAHQRPTWPNSGIIVTQAGLPRVSGLDILIRADAGTGVIPTTWQAYADQATAQPILVVDFADRHHPVLRKRTRDRRQAYLQAGWRLPGELRTDLDHYLASRRN
jgi:hypothetical protein